MAEAEWAQGCSAVGAEALWAALWLPCARFRHWCNAFGADVMGMRWDAAVCGRLESARFKGNFVHCKSAMCVTDRPCTCLSARQDKNGSTQI
jgi:hypothetical protein